MSLVLLPFKSYDDIPKDIAELIKNVADVPDIKKISLDDINGYLTGLEDYYGDINRAFSTHVITPAINSDYDEGGWVFDFYNTHT